MGMVSFYIATPRRRPAPSSPPACPSPRSCPAKASCSNPASASPPCRDLERRPRPHPRHARPERRHRMAPAHRIRAHPRLHRQAQRPALRTARLPLAPRHQNKPPSLRPDQRATHPRRVARRIRRRQARLPARAPLVRALLPERARRHRRSRRPAHHVRLRAIRALQLQRRHMGHATATRSAPSRSVPSAASAPTSMAQLRRHRRPGPRTARHRAEGRPHRRPHLPGRMPAALHVVQPPHRPHPHARLLYLRRLHPPRRQRHRHQRPQRRHGRPRRHQKHKQHNTPPPIAACERRTLLADLAHRPIASPAGASSADPGLKRSLGFRDLTLFYVVSTLSIRWIATAAAAGPGTILVWVFACSVSSFRSPPASWPSPRAIPQEGGIYVWTREAFGDFTGFPRRLDLLDDQPAVLPRRPLLRRRQPARRLAPWPRARRQPGYYWASPSSGSSSSSR